MAMRVQFRAQQDSDSDGEENDKERDQKSEESSIVSGLHLFDGTDNPPEEGFVPKASLGRRLSWTSVSTCDLSEPLYLVAKEDRNVAEKFKLLMNPPQFDRDDLLCSVHNFVGALADYVPAIKQDKTFTVFKSIRSFLSSAESSRLFGLLVHFTYWNVIHPSARATMKALKELQDLKLFTNVDVTTYNLETRLSMPKAITEIDHKDKSCGAKSYEEIDRIFRQQCGDDDGDKRDAAQSSGMHSSSKLPYISENASSVGGISMDSMDTRSSLTSIEKEQLFIQLESCIIALFRKMGRSRFALVTGRQALISCCHFVVDEVLAMIYPWFAPVTGDEDYSDEDEEGAQGQHHHHHVSKRKTRDIVGRKVNAVDLRLRRLVHHSISDIIDPSRVYTSTMLLNALLGFDSSEGIKGVSKKAKSVFANEGKGKFYRTSAAMLAVLGDSNSYQARKFLQRSGSLHVPIPGAVKPFTERHTKKEGKDPKALLEKILHTETAQREENEERRRNPKKLDFNHLFDNQPDANYFPKPVPVVPTVLDTVLEKHYAATGNASHVHSSLAGKMAIEAVRIRSHAHSKGQHDKSRRSGSPSRGLDTFDGHSVTDSLTMNSDGPSMVGNSLAEIPISLKAKSALMNLMVDKTAKLYAAGIQTDKTAMKIAIVKGLDGYHKPRK